MTFEEAYAEHEVDLGASEAEVRQARNILLRVWHPDRHQHDPKLRMAAEQKTTRINAAYDLIEAAGFPGPEAIPKAPDPSADNTASDRATVDQQIRLRELELREREIELQEKLASKPSTTEWIDKKAAQLTSVTVAVGLVGAVLLINFVVVLWLLEGRRFTQPMPMFWCIAIMTVSTGWLLARMRKPQLVRMVGIMGVMAAGFALLAGTGLFNIGAPERPLSLPGIVLLAAAGGAVAEWVRGKLFGR